MKAVFWVSYHNKSAGTHDYEKFLTRRGAAARCKKLQRLGYNAIIEMTYIPGS